MHGTVHFSLAEKIWSVEPMLSNMLAVTFSKRYFCNLKSTFFGLTEGAKYEEQTIAYGHVLT
jgi:hypothetical protein